MSEKTLIITADDFGYCPQRNSGIVDCYKKCGITNTSLLVNGPAARGAVALAKEYSIPLGLHLNLSEGAPVWNSNSSLTKSGKFLGKIGIRDAVKLNTINLEEVKREMESQVNLFREMTGVLPNYVNGHQHVHVLEGIAEAFSQVCTQYGIQSTRLPLQRSEVNTCTFFNRDQLEFYESVVRDSLRAKNVFDKYRLRYAESFIGLTQTGEHLTAARLKLSIDNAFSNEGENSNSCEVMVHPGYPSIVGNGGFGDGPDDFSLSLGLAREAWSAAAMEFSHDRLVARMAYNLDIMAAVSLWIKSEPFTYGALAVAPHPRLSIHNLKKIIPYAKAKGKLGYPRLSYSVWRHIACNKLQLSEDLTWMYFETYKLISDVSPSDRLNWDRQWTHCKTPVDRDNLKSQLTANTLKFVLFLFIQQLHKISLRSSLISNAEEWPTIRHRSPEGDGRPSPANKGLDEHNHLSFVLTNLNNMMELLVNPELYGAGHNDMCLSLEAIQALGYLIGGSVDKSSKPLNEIVMLQPIQQKSGYSKISNTFSFKMLQSWLRSSITNSPYGIANCIASGRRLSWPLAANEFDQTKPMESMVSTSIKRGKIATNAHIVPRDDVKGNRLIVMSQVCKQTIGRCSGSLENANVKIHRCHSAYIYLLGSLRSVTVEKCRNSTIVIGAVETSIHVSNCEYVTIVTACRRLSVSGSTLCTFHVLTPTRPLILGSNDSLIFAPYHTYYGSLENHMQHSGLGSELNVWDQPFCVGPDHHSERHVWELMSPRHFYTFNIPFDVAGPTKSIPGDLPPKYRKSMVQRQNQTDVWQKSVKDASLSREQKKRFQALVEQRFQDWLVDSGHKQEVDGLVLDYSKKK